VPDPDTGEPRWLIGLWVNHPDRLSPPHNGSRYLVRDAAGGYEYADVLDEDDPVPRGSELRAVRAIAASPFPADAGRVVYLGGFDAGGRGTHHETAWIYRGTAPAG
jgi:hypothetical protein